jgi:hypothetical protein
LHLSRSARRSTEGLGGADASFSFSFLSFFFFFFLTGPYSSGKLDEALMVSSERSFWGERSKV